MWRLVLKEQTEQTFKILRKLAKIEDLERKHLLINFIKLYTHQNNDLILFKLHKNILELILLN